VIFAAAVAVAALTSGVPPWAGTGAAVAALLAMLLPDPALRAGLLAAAAAPLLLPALHPDAPGEGSPLVWVLLAVSAGLGVADRPARAALVAGALAIGAVVAVKQEVAAAVLPAAADRVALALTLGWLAATLGAAAPTSRAGAAGVAVVGVLVAASGLRLAERAERQPVSYVAGEVAERRAFRVWPILEARAVEEADQGRIGGALALVRQAPERVAAGEALVRRSGPALALDLGWDPNGALPPQVAVAVARELDARGEGSRAVELLRRQPREGEVAFWLAVLAREVGLPSLAASAWPRAAAPEGVVADPDALIDGEDWLVGTTTERLFTLSAPARGLEITATGDAWEGAPELEIRVGSHSWGPMPVPDASTTWSWPVGLPEGAFRLRASFVNDARGDGGDRNLRGVTIRVVR
jgi:hypothetical protein